MKLRGIIPIRGGLAAVECAAIIQGTSPLRPQQICIVNTADEEGGTEADLDFGADWKVHPLYAENGCAPVSLWAQFYPEVAGGDEK